MKETAEKKETTFQINKWKNSNRELSFCRFKFWEKKKRVIKTKFRLLFSAHRKRVRKHMGVDVCESIRQRLLK